MLSKQGGARLGLVGLQHAAWMITAAEYPIIDASQAEAAGAAAATALLADAKRQSAGRVTSPPDLLLLMSAPVGEEAVLRGVQATRRRDRLRWFDADRRARNRAGRLVAALRHRIGQGVARQQDSVVMVGLYLATPTRVSALSVVSTYPRNTRGTRQRPADESSGLLGANRRCRCSMAGAAAR